MQICSFGMADGRRSFANNVKFKGYWVNLGGLPHLNLHVIDEMWYFVTSIRT